MYVGGVALGGGVALRTSSFESDPATAPFPHADAVGA